MSQNLISYKDLARKTLLRVSTKYLWNIFGLISLIVIQRQYGYEIVGLMAFGMAYISIFLPLADLGFGSAHSKRINEKELDPSICNGTFATIKIVLNFVMITLVILSIEIQSYLGYDFGGIVKIVLYLYLVRYFLYNINKIFNGIFNAKLEVAKKVIPTTISRFVMMILKITIALFFYEELGVEHLIGAEIVAAFLLTIMFSYFLTKIDFKPFNWHYFKLYYSFAFPVIFIGLVTSLNNSIDKVILQYLLGSESVGIYTISERLALFILVISTSITKLLFPSFSSLYSRNKIEKIKKLASLSARYASISLIPIIIVFLIFTEEILSFLFGNEAEKSAEVLRVLIISAYILAISLPYSIQITSTGHLKQSFFVTFFALIINLSLNFLFIPDIFFGFKCFGLGVLGAAYSFCISAIFIAIMGLYYSNKYTKSIFYYDFWKHIASSILVYYLISYFYSLYFIWYIFPIYVIMIVFLFVVFLYILGEFNRQDLKFYVNLISPSRMSKYISKEIRN